MEFSVMNCIEFILVYLIGRVNIGFFCNVIIIVILQTALIQHNTDDYKDIIHGEF